MFYVLAGITKEKTLEGFIMNRTQKIELLIAMTIPVLFAAFFAWHITKSMDMTTAIRSLVCLGAGAFLLLVVVVLSIAGKKQSPGDTLNRVQKIARFMVINITVSIVLSLIAGGLLYLKCGDIKAASAGLAFMGLIGLSGFTPIIFKKDDGAVEFDERDVLINRKAAIAGFASAYLFVGLACMLPYAVMGTEATISVRWLPLIFGGAGILNFYIHSVVILVLYGKGNVNCE